MADLFKPRRVAVPLHYSMISQFMYLWINRGRPCDLRIQRSEKDKETVGVIFNVENNDTVDLIHDLKERLKRKFMICRDNGTAGV